MTDQEMWEGAVSTIREEYACLSNKEKNEVVAVADLIRRTKDEIYLLTEKKGASDICGKCGGACCATGKYHFTVVDLLVFLACDVELFSPSFDRGFCPYLRGGACLMSPSFRPLTCIVFHCEPLECLLSHAELEHMYFLERRLREQYAHLEAFFGTRLTQGLLLNYAACVDGRQAGMLVKKC